MVLLVASRLGSHAPGCAYQSIAVCGAATAELTMLSWTPGICFGLAVPDTACTMRIWVSVSIKKIGSQELALQQQRVLARWEGEGGASAAAPPTPCLHTDYHVSGSTTMTTAERKAPVGRNGRG